MNIKRLNAFYAHPKAFPKKRNRMNVSLFIYYFIILILLFNKIGTVNKKLQKSFNEIFGEGWEEKEQNANANLKDGLRDQRKDGIGQFHTKALHWDQSNNHLDQTNKKSTDQNRNVHENGDQNEDDRRKREIIHCFYAIKEKMEQKGIKCSKRELLKIEETIANKLGTSRNYIYKWIREFGIGKKRRNSNDYSDRQKPKIIRIFRVLKEKAKQKGIKCSIKIECAIARNLGTNRDYIYKWISEFGVGKRRKISNDYTDQQKQEIIRKFRATKEKIKQKGRKYSKKEWNKIEETIANKLGTSRNYIYKWIREFGIGKRRGNSNDYSDRQKKEIVQKFRAIKEKMKEKGIKFWGKEKGKFEIIIAKKLGTNRNTIYKWIKEFDMRIQMKNDEIYSEKQKILIKKFIAMCNECKKKRNHSRNEWGKNYTKISKKLGVCYGTIQRWKKAFGMGRKNYEIYSKNQKFEIVQKFIATNNDYKQKGKRSKKERDQNYVEIANKLGVGYGTIQKWMKTFEMYRKKYRNEEKLQIMGRYWEMKRNMPEISDVKIEKLLDIERTNIRRWKGEFGKERI